MSIPNKPMSGFEKFDITKVSPSQIGNYTSRRSRWVIEKIFKKIVTVGASAHRGTIIEHGIKHFFDRNKLATGNAIEEAVDYGVKEFDNKCKGMAKYAEERLFIEPCIRKGIDEFRKFDLMLFQAELHLDLNGYNVYGYSDFVFQSDVVSERFVVDLKTTKKTPYKINNQHCRQVSIYAKSLECEGKIMYLIPKKSGIVDVQWIDIDDTEVYLKQAEDILKSMDLLLWNCDDKYQVANMCPPDVDDWIWADEQLVEYRKEIWGY